MSFLLITGGRVFSAEWPGSEGGAFPWPCLVGQDPQRPPLCMLAPWGEGVRESTVATAPLASSCLSFSVGQGHGGSRGGLGLLQELCRPWPQTGPSRLVTQAPLPHNSLSRAPRRHRPLLLSCPQTPGTQRGDPAPDGWRVGVWQNRPPVWWSPQLPATEHGLYQAQSSPHSPSRPQGDPAGMTHFADGL